MTDKEIENIKYRLTDIGGQVGELALNYINELEKEISVLLSCANCAENKGGYICDKEYNDKCLSQKIEYIKELKDENSELETQIENYQLAENESKEIIAELKEKIDMMDFFK